MTRIKAFTLIELNMALIIATVMALIIGVLGTMSLGASNKARQEADIYYDITTVLETIQHEVRAAKSLDTTTPCPWTGTCLHLIVDSTAYFVGIQTDVDFRSLVNYKSSSSPVTDNLFMTFSSDDNISFNSSLSGNQVTLTLMGRRNKIDFNVSNTIKRRPL